MWFLNLLQSLALFGAQLLDWMDRQDLKRLGALEVENATLKQEQSDAKVSAEVDSRPTPSNKPDILSRL